MSEATDSSHIFCLHIFVDLKVLDCEFYMKFIVMMNLKPLYLVWSLYLYHVLGQRLL